MNDKLECFNEVIDDIDCHFDLSEVDQARHIDVEDVNEHAKDIIAALEEKQDTIIDCIDALKDVLYMDEEDEEDEE